MPKTNNPSYDIINVRAALAHPGPAAGVIESKLETLEIALEMAQNILRDEDPDLWLSIVSVDWDGVVEPVVEQVEVSS